MRSSRQQVLCLRSRDVAVLARAILDVCFLLTQDHSASVPRDISFDRHAFHWLKVSVVQYTCLPDQLYHPGTTWREHHDHAFVERRKRRSAAIRFRLYQEDFSSATGYTMFGSERLPSHAARRESGAGKELRGSERSTAIKLQQHFRGRITFLKNQPAFEKAKAADGKKCLAFDILVQKRVRGIMTEGSQKLLKKSAKQTEKLRKPAKAEAARKKAEAAAALRAKTFRRLARCTIPLARWRMKRSLKLRRLWEGIGQASETSEIKGVITNKIA